MVVGLVEVHEKDVNELLIFNCDLVSGEFDTSGGDGLDVLGDGETGIMVDVVELATGSHAVTHGGLLEVLLESSPSSRAGVTILNKVLMFFRDFGEDVGDELAINLVVLGLGLGVRGGTATSGNRGHASTQEEHLHLLAPSKPIVIGKHGDTGQDGGDSRVEGHDDGVGW
jgi:hypothetical protein